jgi:hypothetical protein
LSVLIWLRVSGGRPASHAGGFVFATLNAGVRGTFRPGKSCASRGAGVAGAWGAKVAISRRNGSPACVASLMNPTPLLAITSVR